MRFDSEAQDLFNEWHASLEHLVRKDGIDPPLHAHLSKFRSMVPSIALVLHLVDGNQGPVGADAVTKACGWADYLESHAMRVYSYGSDPNIATALLILERIKRRELPNGFSARDIYRHGWSGLKSSDIVKAGLAVLADFDYLRMDEEKTKGRTRIVHFVNPSIWS